MTGPSTSSCRLASTDCLAAGLGHTGLGSADPPLAEIREGCTRIEAGKARSAREVRREPEDARTASTCRRTEHFSPNT